MDKYLEVKSPPVVKLFCIPLTLKNRLVILFSIYIMSGFYSLVSGIFGIIYTYSNVLDITLPPGFYFIPSLVSGTFSVFAGIYGVYSIRAHSSKMVGKSIKIYVCSQISNATFTMFHIIFSSIALEGPFAEYTAIILLVITMVLGVTSYRRMTIYRNWLIRLECIKREGISTLERLHFTTLDV